MKYAFLLSRTVSQIKSVTIEANSEEEAERIALATSQAPEGDEWAEDASWRIDECARPTTLRVEDSWIDEDE